MDVLDRADLPFPHSLPEFQRLFPDDAACAAYLEKARWGDGFACPHCGTAGEPFHFENRPGVLRCRKCRQNTGLTVGTVMERSHTPLNVWFWAAYLVASQTPGMSAVQFQRQLGLSRYETAFQILHKLRSGMVRPNQDRIGGQPKNHVEVDETWVGGRTRGEGRGVHHKVPVSCAIEVRHRKPGTKLDNRKDGRYAVSLRGGPPSRISVIRRGCAIGSGHLFGVHQGLSGHDRRCRKQWRIRGPGGKARVPFVVAGAMPRSAGS